MARVRGRSSDPAVTGAKARTRARTGASRLDSPAIEPTAPPSGSSVVDSSVPASESPMEPPLASMGSVSYTHLDRHERSSRSGRLVGGDAGDS